MNRLCAIGVDRVILDTAVKKGSLDERGGTGVRCDWSVAARIKQQVDMFLFLAGGINPENVRDALLQVHPDGVDLSSGVEQAVGKKDLTLVRRLIEAASVSMNHTP
jgi:phosphoribosylanthranilate isomerase